MRLPLALAWVLAISCTPAGPAPDISMRPEGASVTWSFEGDAAGTLPAGSIAFFGQWAVRAEADAPSPPNALCQTGSAEFPAIALSLAQRADVSVSARVKPISGRQDQAAGLIFRIQDATNYLIVRANALEGNVNIFKYVNGRRSQLAEGKAAMKAGIWYDLRAEAVGDQIRAFFAGHLIAEARDDTFKRGGVGLWTKADSVTCFDDVVVASLAAP